MEKISKSFFCLFCFLFLGCTKENKARLIIFEGYMEWKQNNWINASSSFLNSFETANELNNRVIKAYSDFGLGSTYVMQNEDKSALERFENIKKIKDENLNSSLYYQHGIIAFKMKHYDKAAEYFRKSLEYASNNVDAKINYELSKKYLKKQNSKTQTFSEKGEGSQKNDEVFDKAVMDLIRKKEKEEWQNTNVTEKAPPAYDY